MEFIEFISQPWHWAISGASIAGLMFLMLFAGEKFGVSTSFETLCSIGGAGKKVKLFDYDWRKQAWLIVFVIGAAIGGLIATTAFQSPEPVQISQDTIGTLSSMGVNTPTTKTEGLGFVPTEIFNFSTLLSLKGLIIMIGGGFLIGFGTRYASGCTSGHAISGLANLQLPSLIAVIGFFIGGLAMAHIILPLILSL